MPIYSITLSKLNLIGLIKNKSEYKMSRKKKYNFNPQIDAMIKDTYEARKYTPHNGHLPGLKTISILTGIPRHTLIKRGIELGLARTKESIWSDEEILLLEKYSHLTPQSIEVVFRKKGFTRSRVAINLKMKRKNIRMNHPYYSARQVAIGFGIDSHIISKWIHLGMLQAKMRGTQRGPENGGDSYLIHADEIRKFILSHPTEFAIMKVDQLWFLDIVTKGQISY